MTNAYERKTGPGYAYILCDICGRKIYQKDAFLVTEKYNLHYGLLVCKEDLERTNPQAIPFSVSETQVQNPKLLRSESTDRNVVNPLDNRVPSAPQNLIAAVHPLNATVLLQWQGPQDTGSGPIVGYIITRAEPQLSTQFVINSNTQTPTTSYEDVLADISHSYTYTIAAINTYGTGAYSDVAYFPYNKVADIDFNLVRYLTVSDTGYAILTGDSDAILAGIT